MHKIESALQQLTNAVAIDSATSKPRLSMEDKIKMYTEDKGVNIARPWSYDDYIHRLNSFSKSINWFAKPQIISPLECCRFGWQNIGINKLSCQICNKIIEHNEAIDPEGIQLKSILQSSHELSCAWYRSDCSQSFTQYPMKSSLVIRQEFISHFMDNLKTILITVHDYILKNNNNNNNNNNGTNDLKALLSLKILVSEQLHQLMNEYELFTTLTPINGNATTNITETSYIYEIDLISSINDTHSNPSTTNVSFTSSIDYILHILNKINQQKETLHDLHEQFIHKKESLFHATKDKSWLKVYLNKLTSALSSGYVPSNTLTKISNEEVTIDATCIIYLLIEKYLFIAFIFSIYGWSSHIHTHIHSSNTISHPSHLSCAFCGRSFNLQYFIQSIFSSSSQFNTTDSSHTTTAMSTTTTTTTNMNHSIDTPQKISIIHESTCLPTPSSTIKTNTTTTNTTVTVKDRQCLDPILQHRSYCPYIHVYHPLTTFISTTPPTTTTTTSVSGDSTSSSSMEDGSSSNYPFQAPSTLQYYSSSSTSTSPLPHSTVKTLNSNQNQSSNNIIDSISASSGGSDGCSSNKCGWQINCEELLDHSTKQKRQMSCPSARTETVSTSTNGQLNKTLLDKQQSPEQVYKRIRTMLSV